MPSKLNRSLVVTVVFGLLGILVNLPKLTIFTGATLLFGGALYLMAALLFGPLYGALAALITALPSILLWGHPETACILVAEALAVGWLARRRLNPMLADVIYWAAIGTPLAAVFYFVLFSYPSPYNWVMVVKYPGERAAECNDRGPAHRHSQRCRDYGAKASGPVERKPLRAYLSHGFLLVATVPLLLLNIVNGENYAERQEQEAGQRLQEEATAIRQDLEGYVSRHQLAVRQLSRSITRQGRFDLDSLNGWLQQTRQVYGGFQSITIGNADGFPDRRGSAGGAGAGNGAEQQAGRCGARQRHHAGSRIFPARQGRTAVGDLGSLCQPRGAAAHGGGGRADFHPDRAICSASLRERWICRHSSNWRETSERWTRRGSSFWTSMTA